MWKLLSILGCVLLIGSCEKQSECNGEWIPSVFEGFTYVGAFEVGGAIPAHTAAIQPLPHRFRKNVSYVFHPATAMRTEVVALRTLPDRLRAASVEIIAAPRNEGDFAIPNLGGPIWNIEVKYKGCRAKLRNAYDRGLAEERRGWPYGSFDDYIVEFKF